MTHTAYVAIDPAIASTLDDDLVLEQLPDVLRPVVRGREAGQLAKLNHGGVDYDTYEVRGTMEAMQAAMELWGAQLIVLGTWDIRTGCRGGQELSETRVEGALPAPVVIPAVDIVPATITKHRYVMEDYTYTDLELGVSEVTAKRRVLKEFVSNKGEERDIDGNVTKEGRKLVMYNGIRVAEIDVDQLEPDGTYIYQPPAPVTVTEEITGTPTIPLHAEIFNLLPTIKQFDVDGNLTGESVPADFGHMKSILGHAPRRM